MVSRSCSDWICNNRWTQVGPAFSGGNHKKMYAQFKCACGVIRDVLVISVRSGVSKSCGCHKNELFLERVTKHGMRHTAIYAVWCGMIQRCTNPNHSDYKDYKDRGVCTEWLDFKTFYSDVGDRPHNALTLERRDNSRGYEPGNVCWATMREQNRNRKDNRSLTVCGITKLRVEWAEIVGISAAVISDRTDRYGWSEEDAVLTPLGKKRGSR